MTLLSRFRLEQSLLFRRIAHWWTGDTDRIATLKAEIDLALLIRKRGRPERQEASRKGWAARKRATRSHASHQAPTGLGPTGFDQAQGCGA